jgi:hypothetical protein
MSKSTKLRTVSGDSGSKNPAPKPPSQKPLVEPPTVSRLFLVRQESEICFEDETSDTSSCSDCGEEGYIIGWGERPKGMKGPVTVANRSSSALDIFYEGVCGIDANPYKIPIEDGPYADKGGRVDKFAKIISRGNPDNIVIFDRTIQFLGSREVGGMGAFSVDREFADIPDVLPTAGEILSQGSRQQDDNRTGKKYRILTHLMEPLILAVSILRRNGINAYPSLGVIPQGRSGEILVDLISVIEPNKDTPLTTFALAKIHPPIVSIDVISDAAMKGVTHVILAESRLKHLTSEMVELSKTNRSFSDDELENQLKRIAEQLFECHKRWPGTHYISEALEYFKFDLFDALMAIQKGNVNVLLEQHPELVSNPGLVDQMQQEYAGNTAQTFADNVMHYFSTLIVQSDLDQTE